MPNHLQESLAVLAFLLVLLFVYAGSGWILWRRFWGRPIQSVLAKALLGAAFFGCLCIAYGYFIEPYWPEVTHVQLTSEKLSKLSRPVRLVLFSDLHCDPKVRLEERLPGLIAAQHPDAILFAGDAVNSPDGVANFRTCMKALAKIAPVFVVKGNWDVDIWPGQNLFTSTGVRELDGEAVSLPVAGTKLWIGGISAHNREGALTALRSIPPNAYTVFIRHFPFPDTFEPADQKRVDLFVSGHVHGGQVALPIYGALLTLSKYGKQYEQGLYHVGPMALYVTRGIGMEGGSAPRVRFWARPEITVIELQGEAANQSVGQQKHRLTKKAAKGIFMK